MARKAVVYSDTKADALAAAAATKFLRAVLTYDELHEHAGGELFALVKYIKQTRLANVTDEEDRQSAAESETAFRIAQAIFRAKGGA